LGLASGIARDAGDALMHQGEAIEDVPAKLFCLLQCFGL
jgi:hypothetical protein